jgi:dihydrodipicolinate synthase/N-acetylneuraminate lyase
MTRLEGALAASVTPLTAQGDSLDEPAFQPLLDFLVTGGLDGMLALGTTGEGVLLSLEERMRAAALFVRAADRRLRVAVHCGAQSTRDTALLAAHAAEAGADAVAVIGPPYFAFDAESLFGHFATAARACAPLPFYIYEFQARSGYAVSVDVVRRVQEVAPNLTGMKVSDTPFERVRPYLLAGLDVFVGAESLVVQALEAGATGAVSGLASAFPELIAALVKGRDLAEQERVGRLRAELHQLPVPAVFKAVLGRRGVPVGAAVRAPLRTLDGQERDRLERVLRGILTDR